MSLVVVVVVVDILVDGGSPDNLCPPFALLEEEGTLRYVALLAESSGTNSLDGGLSLLVLREVGPRREKDDEGTRLCCGAERALAVFDILDLHETSPLSAVFTCDGFRFKGKPITCSRSTLSQPDATLEWHAKEQPIKAVICAEVRYVLASIESSRFRTFASGRKKYTSARRSQLRAPPLLKICLQL